MSGKEYADGYGEGMADRLRYITVESSHEAISRRADVDDSVIDVLRPLVARAIDTGQQVDIPGGYWVQTRESRDGEPADGVLAVVIGHSDTGADVQVSMVVVRGPSHRLPVLRVRTGTKALRRIARELGDLDRCIAWAFLEVWEQWHRAMGEKLRAILEEEQAYWSTVRWPKD